MIDGSEFTGKAELDLLLESRFIMLDDVCTFKNFDNRRRLLADCNFELMAEDLSHRNGYSAFRRTS